MKKVRLQNYTYYVPVLPYISVKFNGAKAFFIYETYLDSFHTIVYIHFV